MRKPLVIGCLAVVAAAAVAWHIRSRAASSRAPTLMAAPLPSTGALGVETLMRNVDRQRGRVTVEGVVSAASATGQTLALIDFREFQQCGLEQCAELTLPVRWTGAMPPVGQAVRVEGKVQEAGGKLVFVAQTLKAVATQPAKAK